MKKILSTIAVAAMMLVMAMPAEAQVKFGVRAGANLVNLKLSSANDLVKNNAGFYVGPTVKFTLPIVGLGVDASVVYDQRTAKLAYYVADNNGNGETEVEDNVTARAISIPINVRYGVGLGSLAEVFAFAGPQFGFNLSGDKKIFDELSDWTWKSSNFSVNVGIGATILSKVEIKANYNIACGKTGEASVIQTGKSVFNGKYNSWQIGAAYYF
ncbi:MAG: porin family protein [Prevotella sp.]|nr:porin family protein [Prevotella sp.]